MNARHDVGRLARQHLCNELSERSIDTAPSEHRGYIHARPRGFNKNKGLDIRVYAGSGEHFTLRQSDLEPGNCILAYVWDADFSPEIYFASPDEALNFLGSQPLATRSWKEQGYYKWSSASQLPTARRAEFVKRFGDRWEWLIAQLKES